MGPPSEFVGDVAPGASPEVPFRAAVRFWVLLGFINFGGPTGQIAIMHDELVERRRWIGEDRFLHALSYCMLLPGPEAQQLAIYVGWLLHGTLGGIVAGVAFVLPAAVLLLGLAWVYVAHGDLAWVAAVFAGLSAAVVGIVASATIQIGRRALRARPAWVVAALAFVAIAALGVPFPFVVLGAGAVGLLVADRLPRPAHGGTDGDGGPADDAAAVGSPTASSARAAKVLLLGLLVWWVPVAVVTLATGAGSVFSREALFFSQVAVITFGGAYAVLAYVAEEVVARFGLSTADVVAGLGLAESTPGPLIMVVQFVGFVAAYRDPGSLSPLAAGILGAAITSWVTFAPSFLWILLGAPYVERLRGNVRVAGALSMITAAVVGVIASLALTFATAVVFDEVRAVAPLGHPLPWPVLTSMRGFPAVVAAASFVAAWRFRVPVPWIVAASAAAGLLWTGLW